MAAVGWEISKTSQFGPRMAQLHRTSDQQGPVRARLISKLYSLDTDSPTDGASVRSVHAKGISRSPESSSDSEPTTAAAAWVMTAGRGPSLDVALEILLPAPCKELRD